MKPVAICIIALLISASTASAQASPPRPDPFKRSDGQPTDKVLLRASNTCHAHNPDAASAKENCAVFDAQIAKRSTESDASSEIRARANELQQ